MGNLPAADEARRRERWLGCLPFTVGGGDGDERVDDVLKNDEDVEGTKGRRTGARNEVQGHGQLLNALSW